MGNRDSVKFRGHLGGFNRADVNSFIKETDRKHSEEIDRLNGCIASLQSKLDETGASVSRLSAENDALREKTAEKEKRVAELEKAALEKEAEIAACRDTISQLKDELRDASGVLDSFKGELQALRERENETVKAAQATASTFEKVKARLNGMTADANRKSDSIIDNAKAKAREIISAAETECEEKKKQCEATIAKMRSEADSKSELLRDRISKTAGDFLSNAGSDLNESIESCMREVNSCVSDVESQVKGLLAKVADRSEELNERIQYYQKYLANGFSEKMSQINRIYGDDRKENDAQAGSDENDAGKED